MKSRVSFVTLALPHYRRRFHELTRELLSSKGIRYELIYSDPLQGYFSKDDAIDLPWAIKVKSYKIHIGSEEVYWQSAIRTVAGSDLTIVPQEGRLLFNYWCHLKRIFGNRMAYFGHGRNFQGPTDTFESRFKAFWSKRVDWWFAYTDQTRRIVTEYGFPADRITVFNNSIDTSEIRRIARELDEDKIDKLRAKFGISTNRIGVYVGRLYDVKRVDFLIDAAIEIRRRVPDFTLVVVGGGDDSDRVKAAAEANPWMIYLGPRYGREMVEILRLGRVFLMPGAVGLSVLDCAAAAIPMVTTAYPFHGPEIAYLESNHNGLIVQDWRNLNAYADAVISVLTNDKLYYKLATGALKIGETYTIEQMAERFSEGVINAINFT
jgi:glycosyltransferase involved in cell wall biosynthesis